MSRAILLISCPDQKGITATVTNFVFQNNGNIVHADQHIDEEKNTFLMRLEWSLDGFCISKESIAREFAVVAEPYQMSWDLSFSNEDIRIAIFVSKHLHCLNDLLMRFSSGQLACRIPLIISNHADGKQLARNYGINFFEFPINSVNKISQEKRQMALLKEGGIDLIVLARYHQILSPDFVNAHKNRIINIHHSFLPAFAGKSPYRQAYRKGVKIIGATSHYVTHKLDEGPIIEQDTVRISHRDSLEDLIRKGQDLERLVLSRALRWHLEKKVLTLNNKTIVFD